MKEEEPQPCVYGPPPPDYYTEKEPVAVKPVKRKRWPWIIVMAAIAALALWICL